MSIIRKKSGTDYGKPDVDLLLATKAIIDRDLSLDLVTLDRLRYSIMSTEDLKLIAPVLKANGMSDRKIAKVAGTSHQTVARILRGPNGPENGPNGPAQALQAKDDARKAALHKRVKADSRLHVGDFRKLAPHAIPDESVELVLTDPPYDRDSIPLYGAAALEAARILKPGGSMISYCGHVILPHVLPEMTAVGSVRGLKYFWIGACVHSGSLARMNRYGITVGFKPLLWFVKNHRGEKQKFVCDTVVGTQEKAEDSWQQAVSEAEHFIAGLTSDRGTVVDFFAGSGTTVVAAQKLGRQWIAFESDPDVAETMQERIADA